MRRACFLRFTTVLHITPFFYSHYRRIRQTDITNSVLIFVGFRNPIFVHARGLMDSKISGSDELMSGSIQRICDIG